LIEKKQKIETNERVLLVGLVQGMKRMNWLTNILTNWLFSPKLQAPSL
jgi:hypothetical protein